MRQSLISFRGYLLTKDTAKAVEALEVRAAETGWRVRLTGPVPGSHEGDPFSLIPAGREVHLTLTQGDSSEQSSLNALWGCAVPLGFTPWCRYPLVDEDKAHVFHYFGPWRTLHDRLMSEGRGHLAWPSVCCAAQCDVGQWRGDRTAERLLQAQLHRVGRNCGPIDGILGPRTAMAIQSLSLGQVAVSQLLEHLYRLGEERRPPSPHQVGHVALPNRQLTIAAVGGVKVARTKQGAVLTVDGPGRVILDIGDPA